MKQKDIQEKIDKFIKEIFIIYPQMEFVKVDEDFTSVEAAAQTGEFKKSR
jgi:RNase H-fold protein (predicted Holliday junction resolvase)